MKMLKLLGIAVLISSSVVGPALAFHVPFRWWRVYYAEPELVTVVGEKMLECTGSYMLQGEVTPYYYEIDRERCPD